MRVALYFTPSESAPLTIAASTWLRRNAYGGGKVSAVAVPDMAADEHMNLVRSPAKYGFHATLKAPFSLARGTTVEALQQELTLFAGKHQQFSIPEVTLGRLGAFYALVPSETCMPLNALAEGLVSGFEPFRAPLSEEDLERRRQSSLTAAQDALLVKWGYPYVFDEFRFHMTLTGPVETALQDKVDTVLRAHFAPFIDQPLLIDAVCLFVEPERGADFVIASRHPLAV